MTWFGRSPIGKPAIVGIYAMVTMMRPALGLLESLRRQSAGSAVRHRRTATDTISGTIRRPVRHRFPGRPILLSLRSAKITWDYRDRRKFCSSLDLADYPGLFTVAGGVTVQNATMNHLQEAIDSLPIPDRSDIDHRSYQEFWLEKTGGKMATIMVTRGCPYNCDFCSKPIFGNVIRKRSIAGRDGGDPGHCQVGIRSPMDR